MIHLGKHGDYHWLVTNDRFWSIDQLVVQFHLGQRLCIAAFDAGPLVPTHEELAQGWTTQRLVAISPPIYELLDMPYDNHDEWYVMSQPNFADVPLETFVQHGAFTLQSPEEIYSTYDATWEKGGFDWLTPVQERFWAQLHRIQPESYLSLGDNEVIVTRNHAFLPKCPVCR